METSPGDTPPQPSPSADPLPACWHLTPAQHAHILHTQIIPTELGPYLPAPPTAPSKKPQAILILGQTGAGKTRFTPSLLAPLDKPLHLIADTFKTYHPFYTACRTSSFSFLIAVPPVALSSLFFAQCEGGGHGREIQGGIILTCPPPKPFSPPR